MREPEGHWIMQLWSCELSKMHHGTVNLLLAVFKYAAAGL